LGLLVPQKAPGRPHEVASDSRPRLMIPLDRKRLIDTPDRLYLWARQLRPSS